ncbi:MAG: HAD-IA family hydrolase [Elusimicrobia bacterium]|nr:HAD-IA family hydrolase [Elusimicrobiota bacterium]
MKKEDIELILFDFGGVIAPEGFQLGVLKLAHMYGKTFEEMYEIAGYEAGMDTGYTAGGSPEENYWAAMARILGEYRDISHYRDLYLDNFEPRKDMVEFIAQLSQKNRLGIFSDQTNWIYEIDEQTPFLKYFDYKCISFEKGYTKHDDEFYLLPSQETGVAPEKILVIDDKKRVVERAKSFGMQGYLFVFIRDCIEYLRPFLS